MSKAAELAALIGSQSALSNRNLIINGAMQVAQRGTSSNNINSFASVDRFNSSKANDDELAGTQAQSTTAPDGFSNSYKIDCTTAESAVAADEYWRVRHHIEAQNLQQLKYGTSGAQSVTLSFYVRSNVTGTYSCALYQEDGDSGSGRIIGSTYTISSADTWEYKTITFAGDTGGTINNDNGEGLTILWALMAGSNYTATDNTSWGTYAAGKLSYGHAVNMGSSTSNEWYITGVQLEVGEQATPFEHRSFGDEFQRCQRYYQNLFPVTASARVLFPVGHYADGDYLRFIAEFSAMRAAPSVTYTGTGNTHYGVASNATIITGFTFGSEQISERSCVLKADKTSHGVSGTNNSVNFFTTNNGGPKLDAEL